MTRAETYLSDDELAAVQTLNRDTPYVIRGISGGMFSIARHYGGMTYQGKSYEYCAETDECVRRDVVKFVAKMRKAKPGRRSVGWSHMPDAAVTCPACIKKLPTHWMDDRGYVVTEEFLRSPRSSSDWIDAYNIPCHMVRGKVTPMGQTP